MQSHVDQVLAYCKRNEQIAERLFARAKDTYCKYEKQRLSDSAWSFINEANRLREDIKWR